MYKHSKEQLAVYKMAGVSPEEIARAAQELIDACNGHPLVVGGWWRRLTLADAIDDYFGAVLMYIQAKRKIFSTKTKVFWVCVR